MGSRMYPPSVVITRPSEERRDGCSVCCCSCSCLHLSFLHNVPGLLKLSQVVLGGMCESLLINFGLSQSQIIGSAYISMLSTCTAATSTATLLLISYLISQKSFHLIRSSVFEIVFNLFSAFGYWSSSTYLAIVVKMYLYPLYTVTLGFIAYPAMVAAYMLGFVLGAVHALDAYQNYMHFKGAR